MSHTCMHARTSQAHTEDSNQDNGSIMPFGLLLKLLCVSQPQAHTHAHTTGPDKIVSLIIVPAKIQNNRFTRTLGCFHSVPINIGSCWNPFHDFLFSKKKKVLNSAFQLAEYCICYFLIIDIPYTCIFKMLRIL